MSSSEEDNRVARRRIRVRARTRERPRVDSPHPHLAPLDPAPQLPDLPHEAPQQPAEARPARPRRREASPRPHLLGHLRLILHHTLELFITLLAVLKIPLVIAIGLLLPIYMYEHGWGVFKTTTCSISWFSSSSICKEPVHIVPPVFASAIKQERAVAQMQEMASDSSALPFQLLSEQSAIKDLIFQVSAADLPSKKKLMPKVNRYNTLIAQVVDAIQDSQIKTDTLVDNTIETYRWAEERLEEIHSERSSLMAPLKDLAAMIGLSLTNVSNEQAIQEVFYGYTDRLANDAEAVVMQYQKARGYIMRFRDLLDNLALDFKQEGDVLDKEKLKHASYWKWLLRSHRQKTADFDKMMELCAKFYKHLIEGGKVVEVTLFKMQEMRGRITALRDEFKKAPLPLLDGQTKPVLRLSINQIKAAAAYLENARTISHNRRERRMIKFEEDMSKSKSKGE